MTDSEPVRRPRRILNSTCSVCGSLASSHIHYGAISCYSCRAFFRRGLPRQTTCIFQTNKCLINCFNRTNCKRCRYNRCLEAGMKPELVDAALKKRGSRKNSNSTSSGSQEDENPDEEAINQEDDTKPVIDDGNDDLGPLSPQSCCPVKSCKYVVGPDEVIQEVKSEDFIDDAEPETYKKRNEFNEKLETETKLTEESVEPFHGNKLIPNSVTQFHTNKFAQESMAQFHTNKLAQESLAQFHTTKLAQESLAQFHTTKLAHESLAQFHSNKLAQDTMAQLQGNRLAQESLAQIHGNKMTQDTMAQTHSNKPNQDSMARIHGNKLNQDSMANIHGNKLAQDTMAQLHGDRLAQDSMAQIRKRESDSESSNRRLTLCNPFSELSDGAMMNVDGLLNYYLEKESKRLKQEQETSGSEERPVKSLMVRQRQQVIQENTQSPVRSLVALQKHHNLQEIVYPISAAVNQKLCPVMNFTNEEDLQVKGILYKREVMFDEYFCSLQGILPTMHHDLINLINCIRCNKTYLIDEHVIQSIANVMKSINLKHMKWLYPEFSRFTTSFIDNVLSSTCNGLFTCFFAFILCKNRNNRIVDQWVNFFLSPDMVKWMLKAIPDLETTRSCTLADFEMFASPWAARIEDEEFFKNTIGELVEIIDGDDTLIALYGLLIRVSPRVSANSAVGDHHSVLKPVQNHICCLIYGFLKRKFALDGNKAALVTKSMQGLVEKLHICGDIFFRKRLIIMYQPNQLLDDRLHF